MPLAAGSIAVFQPHASPDRANLTIQVRKAYILQYAPDSAVVHPQTGAQCSQPTRRTGSFSLIHSVA